MSLMEELGVQRDPEFSLELPPGWARFDVAGDAKEILLAGMKKRFLEAHRPDLFPSAKETLENTFQSMSKNGVFAFFAPAEAYPDQAAIPASINASIRASEPGKTLDSLARDLIQKRGAQPLLGDARILRFESQKKAELGGESIVSHSLIYITPVPGSRRRRALQLVAGYARPAEVAEDAPAMVAARNLFDACVATLSWNRGQ